MSDLAPLPLPLSELPTALVRFCDPAAKGPARTMAAKGLVPLKGGELVTMLVQLGADADTAVSAAAKSTLAALPDAVLLAACDEPLHASVLDALAHQFDRDDVRERVVANPRTHDTTLARAASEASENLAERIATNEARLLRAPSIIEALYKNRNTRMSTADRLVDLAVRNQVELQGIATFAAHAEALKGELLPEATTEALPTDVAFQEALTADDDDPEVTVSHGEDGEEEVQRKYIPLSMQIANMTNAEKIRLAFVGGASARALLVRDPNRIIAHAAISAPNTTAMEAIAIANSRQIGEEVLRYIGNKKEWLRSYELKRALVFNAKTPVGIALRFLSHLQEKDVRELSRSRNIAGPIKTAAIQRIAKKQNQGGGSD